MPDIEKAILKTLHECMEGGFDKTLIESAIHQIEIRNKEVHSNFGLAVISSMIPYALHGDNPTAPLYITEHVRKLQAALDIGEPVFQDLIRRFLWVNPHKLVMRVRPDPEFLNERNAFEVKLLKRLDADLSETDRNSLVVSSEQLAESQNSLQDSDILPTLQISDIAKTQEYTPYTQVSEVSGVPFHVIEQATNGITYIRFKINVKDVPLELRHLLPLYAQLVNKIGTQKYAFDEFDNLKSMYTLNGFSASLNTTSH